MKQLSLALVLCAMAAPVLAGEAKQQQGAATGPYQGAQQSELSQVNRPEIRQIQEKLQQQGYDVGRVDGLWGPQSQQALQQWQKDQGLEVTGRINRQSLAELGIEPQSQTAETPAE